MSIPTLIQLFRNNWINKREKSVSFQQPRGFPQYSVPFGQSSITDQYIHSPHSCPNSHHGRYRKQTKSSNNRYDGSETDEEVNGIRKTMNLSILHFVRISIAVKRGVCSNKGKLIFHKQIKQFPVIHPQISQQIHKWVRVLLSKVNNE